MRCCDPKSQTSPRPASAGKKGKPGKKGEKGEKTLLSFQQDGSAFQHAGNMSDSDGDGS